MSDSSDAWHDATGRPSTPTEASRFIASLLEADARVFVPGAGFAERLVQLAADLGISGRRMFDLQVALAAFEGGCTEIWTADRHFVPVPGLRVVHPLD